jgi:RimJ/RimL family protein N-acetyltransferase
MRQTIDTPRLRLTPLTEADAPAIERGVGDARVARMLRVIPHPLPADFAAPWIARLGQGVAPEWAWGLRLREGGDLIGVISFRYGEGADEPRLGYWLAVEHWGRGLMSEAVGAVVAALFEDGAPAVVANVFADNAASRRILERLGFVFDAAPDVWNEARQAHVPYAQGRLARAVWTARRLHDAPAAR